MVRYPDTAIIKYSSYLATNNEGDVDVEDTELEVKGRFEPMTGKGKNVTDYAGKFYSKKLDLEQFKIDNSRLVLNGDREFVIVNMYNYQNHCEIWVQ